MLVVDERFQLLSHETNYSHLSQTQIIIMEICKRPTYQNILTAQGAYTSKDSDNMLQHKLKFPVHSVQYHMVVRSTACEETDGAFSSAWSSVHLLQAFLVRFILKNNKQKNAQTQTQTERQTDTHARTDTRTHARMRARKNDNTQQQQQHTHTCVITFYRNHITLTSGIAHC